MMAYVKSGKEHEKKIYKEHAKQKQEDVGCYVILSLCKTVTKRCDEWQLIRGRQFFDIILTR